MPQSFNPHDFFELAKELATNPTEARLRTAVSRAYYAAFLVARQKTGVREMRHAHDQVQAALRQRAGCEKIAQKLGMLERLRKTADYNLAPMEPTQADWSKNWTKVEALTTDILPKLNDL